jgi:hypothetical protein
MVLPRDYFFNLYTDQAQTGLVVSGGRTVIPPMSASYRRNVGFRTFSDVEIVAVILRKDGRQDVSGRRTFPGEYATMMSIDQFVREMFGAQTIGADDGLEITTSRGQAVVFYSYTDNRTNDPALVVTPAHEVNVMLNQVR